MTARQYVNGNRAVVEKNGTNTWQIVIMAGAVMLTLASQFWTLANPRDDIRTLRVDLQASIDRQEKELRDIIDKDAKRLEELSKAMDVQTSTLARRVETEVVGLREHEEFVKREDARIATLEGTVSKLQDNLVTRAEHQTHWGDTDQRFSVVNGRLDQLINQLISASSLGDQLKALQKQIDDIRSLQAGVNVRVPSSFIPGTPIQSH